MSDEDSAVGYGRPPKETRFKPGRSGNPSGKPKGLRSIGSELRTILAQEISVAAANGTTRVTKQHALASALVKAAIDGDLRATAIILNHLERGGSQERIEDEVDFSALDRHRRFLKT